MNEKWYIRPFRTFQTNLREIDAGLDVEKTLDTIEEYGANTWLLSVAGIIANYPSTLESQTVNPALVQRESGDLVSDAVEAAGRRGIRVLGRMDFSKIDARRAEMHPEWCFVSPQGEPQIYNGYRSVCPSGSYYQEEMFKALSEILERYPLSGFFFNWMSFNEVDYSRTYWGVCHCDACKAGFAAYAPGVRLPVGLDDERYAVWEAFSSSVLADLNVRMREHIAELAPEAALIQRGEADVTFHEANNAVGRPLWHHQTSEHVSLGRSADPARPVFVNGVAFVDMPYRWAGEDPHHFSQYLLQAIAHGAHPSTYIMGVPEDSPFAALEASGRINRFHRDHEELYDGLHSAARTALVRPEGGGNIARGDFEGTYLALIEAHVPFDVVAPADLATIRSGRFDLLILADIGELSGDAAANLDRLLEDGATVVTTGSSAWAAGRHQLGGDEPAAQQLAEFTTEESLRSLHLPVGQTPGDYVPAVGSFKVLRPTEGAVTRWEALGRSLYGPPEKCYGNAPTQHPGWIQRRLGRGTLVIVPWVPGYVYRRLGLSVVRDSWVEALVDAGGTHLRLASTLSERAQVVLGRTASATVIHVLNRSGDAPQRFLAPLSLPEATLRVPMPHRPTAVHAHVARDDLEWAWDDGTLNVSTPQIDLFEVITAR